MSENTKQPEDIKQPEDNSNTPGPEEKEGTTGGKTFTQEDVNRIISERLAREREKAAPAQPDPTDQREQELAAREAALTCREFISASGYPVELLEVFDTSNADTFKGQVEKLLQLFPEINPKIKGELPSFTAPTNNGKGGPDPLAEAFRLKR